MDAVETEFWRVLSRALGQRVEPGHHAPADLPRWDSLRHVELVFELEEAFKINIPQADIAGLFSSTDEVLSYLRRQGARA
jgi:acyl carrier protein